MRDFPLDKILDRNGKYSKKLFDIAVFNEVKVGELGQLYWDGIAEMTLLDGSVIPTEYDICPDFAYEHSESVFDVKTF